MSAGIIRPTQSGLRPNRDWRRFCVGKKGGGGGGGTAVDMYTTFQASTAIGSPIVVADLNGSTTKTAAAAGTWTIPVVAPIVDDNSGISFDPSPKKFSVSGSPLGEGGSKCMKMNTAADQIQCRYTLTTPSPAVSIGYAMYLRPGESSFNFYNFGDIAGTNGSDYAAVHFRSFIPDQAAIEDGASNLGTLITISGAQWYWITLLYDNPGNAIKMRIYDPLNSWAQVGAESALTPTLSFDADKINVGRTDNHDVFGSFDFHCDCLAIALSTGVGATFPLLPT